MSVKSEQTSFDNLTTIFLAADAQSKLNRARFLWESRTVLSHSHGSSTTYISILKGTLQHYFPSPRDSYGIHGIPAICISMQVSSAHTQQLNC